MDLYLVALANPSADAWGALADRFPNRRQVVSDTMASVAPDGISTPTTVKE